MRIRINGNITFETKYTLIEIANNIANRVCEVSGEDNLINWGNVVSVEVLK